MSHCCGGCQQCCWQSVNDKTDSIPRLTSSAPYGTLHTLGCFKQTNKKKITRCINKINHWSIKKKIERMTNWNWKRNTNIGPIYQEEVGRQSGGVTRALCPLKWNGLIVCKPVCVSWCRQALEREVADFQSRNERCCLGGKKGTYVSTRFPGNEHGS